MARQSLQNSLYSVCIRQSQKLLAMGRVVGDGAMYFYIQDVIVEPVYQGQGLGHEIMLNIEQYLQTAANKGATIGLMAAQGKTGFYLRYGYIERPNATLGPRHVSIYLALIDFICLFITAGLGAAHC
ncbi:GNAT family N-acetyltransferase [Paraglaciecola sp. Hal342]